MFLRRNNYINKIINKSLGYIEKTSQKIYLKYLQEGINFSTNYFSI